MIKEKSIKQPTEEKIASGLQTNSVKNAVISAYRATLLKH
jgi:hypothetical protein